MGMLPVMVSPKSEFEKKDARHLVVIRDYPECAFFGGFSMNDFFEFLKLVGPAYIAYVAATRNHRVTRLWDYRKKAYDELLEALDICRESSLRLARKTGKEKYDSEDEAVIDKEAKKYSDAFELIKKISFLSSYMLSGEAKTLLRNLISKIHGVPRDFNEDQKWMERHYTVIDEINNVALAARHDLDFSGKMLYWLQRCLTPFFRKLKKISRAVLFGWGKDEPNF